MNTIFWKKRDEREEDFNFDQIKEAKSPITSLQHLIISRMS